MTAAVRRAVVRLSEYRLREARSGFRPLRLRNVWPSPYPGAEYAWTHCADSDEVDLFLEGPGLPLCCQADGYRRLRLPEVERGLDDYTALILGVGDA